jgi:hypothetical protein
MSFRGNERRGIGIGAGGFLSVPINLKRSGI